MKQIPILSGRCLVVELPEMARLRGLQKLQPNGLIYADPHGHDVLLDLPPGNWRIIGMLSEVTESEAAGLVENVGNHITLQGDAYENYQDGDSFYETALESLESAILAEGWYFENPYGMERQGSTILNHKKMKMKKKVNYKCKDNDVKLQFHCKDGVIDEVWVQIDGEKSWTIIGYNDLINGIKKAESKSKPKTSHDFGGGYIGEALSSLNGL